MSLSRRLRWFRAGAAALALVMAWLPAAPALAHLDPPGRRLRVNVAYLRAWATQDLDDGLDGNAELELAVTVTQPGHGATFSLLVNDSYDWDDGRYVLVFKPSGPGGRVTMEFQWQPPPWVIRSIVYQHEECTPRTPITAEMTMIERDVDGLTVIFAAVSGVVIGLAGGALGGPVVGAVLGGGAGALIHYSQADDHLGDLTLTVPPGTTTAFLRGRGGGADVEIHSSNQEQAVQCPGTGTPGPAGTIPSPGQSTAAVFDPLQEALAAVPGIRPEAGNPGNLSESDILEIRTVARSTILGLGAIAAGLALNNAYGLAGYDEAALGLAEALELTREHPAAALALFRNVYLQALTAAAEGAPATSPPGAPLQVLPLADHVSVRRGAKIPLPLVVTGSEGPVSLTVSGLPPGAAVETEPVTGDGLVQRLTLDLRNAAPGSYVMRVTAAGPGGARASKDIAVRVHPAPERPANRAPAVGSAPETLFLTEGGPAALLDLAALFDDPDGDPLDIQVSTADDAVASLGWDEESQALSVIPQGVGTTEITLTAGDGDGASATLRVPVVVATGVETVTLNGSDIRSRLGAGGRVGLNFESPGVVVLLNPDAVQALREAAALLEISTAAGAVEVPAGALAALPAGGAVRLALRPLPADAWPGVADVLAEASAQPAQAGAGIVFEAAGADGAPLPLAVPVTIRMGLGARPNPARSTAAAVVDGRLRPVPTRFEDGAVVIQARRSGVFTVATRDLTFSDTAGHWARDSVALLAGKLIVGGVGQGRFAPDRPVTRAEVAAIVARGLGLGLQATSAFRDVGAGAWYNGEVGAAVAAGLVTGYGDGTFRPGRDMTRAEAAAVLVRALEAATGSTLVQGAGGQALAGFADARDIPTWAVPYLDAAVREGLLGGYPDRTLRPGGHITRAELVAMVTRMLEAAGLIQAAP